MKSVFFPHWQNYLAAGLFLALGGSLPAMFRLPEQTPVDRLVKNAGEYLAKHPQSAEGQYTLARIHYLAFHLKTDQVPAFKASPTTDELPAPAPQWMLGGTREKDSGGSLSPAQVVAHAAEAMQGFNATLRMNMKAAQYFEDLEGAVYLGIASLEEEFLDWSARNTEAKPPPDLAGLTPARIRAAYAKALQIAMPVDSKLKYSGPAGIGAITAYEAASALVRLAGSTADPLSDTERKEVEQAKAAMAHFKSLPSGPITPIVFALRPAAHLDELLAPETTVDFDLRGYGPRESWPWVQPELGLLAWEPQRTGVIKSGRQFFGGYTFQIFRANGYEALAALDDNHDGALTDSELDGICVWFDRDGDGTSSPGEVFSLSEVGVVSLAVTMDGYDGIHPTNARGIVLRDGRALRTWDWMVEPAPSQKERAF